MGVNSVGENRSAYEKHLAAHAQLIDALSSTMHRGISLGALVDHVVPEPSMCGGVTCHRRYALPRTDVYGRATLAIEAEWSTRLKTLLKWNEKKKIFNIVRGCPMVELS